MTLLAGAHLADGVLIAADSRITWQASTGPLVTDTAQKLIQLGPSTVLGYTGDVQTINYLLPHFFEVLKRHPQDALSVRRWLPRFLRRSFSAVARQCSIDHVDFMVAGSYRGRPCKISREVLWKMVEDTHALEVNNWLDMRCLQNWTSTDTDPVAVPESSEGVLYTLSSPEFSPRMVPPLDVVALGSGAEVAENLRAYRPLLMCMTPTKARQVFVDALAACGESLVH